MINISPPQSSPAEIQVSPGDDRSISAHSAIYDLESAAIGHTPNREQRKSLGAALKARLSLGGVKKQFSMQLGPEYAMALAWSDMHVTIQPTRDVNETVHDLTRCKRTRKAPIKVLRGVTGIVRPRQLLAIMGPSGCGKTTLLDTLANRVRRGHVQGEIIYGGMERSEAQRRAIMAYVTQEDSLLGDFTVRETLTIAARFYFGYFGPTRGQIADRIEEVIDALGLASCADTIVGSVFFKGLSGGQKRRLSIGVEIISNPPIILLDECTSGLDAVAAYAIVEALKNLADRGHTIITTIHQPSSDVWQMFDQLLLLAKGRTAYFGPAANVLTYFEGLGYTCPKTYNPADYVLNLVATDFDIKLFPKPSDLEALCDAFDQRPVTNAIMMHKQSSFVTTEKVTKVDMRHSSSLEAFMTLTHRNFFNLVRNPAVLAIRLNLYISCAILWGFCTFQLGYGNDQKSVQAQLAQIFSFQAFFALMTVAVLPFLVEERTTFLRESRNGAYAVEPYILGFLVGNILPGTVITALTTTPILVFLIGYLNWYIFFLCTWAVLITAECFVLFLGTWSPHYIIGITIGAAFFAVSMTFENFFTPLSEITWILRWIAYVTPLRFGFRALIINQYTDFGNMTVPGWSNGIELLSYYGVYDDYVQSIEGNIGIVLLFGLSYLWLAWLVLKYYW